jgi:hypothetical protein
MQGDVAPVVASCSSARARDSSQHIERHCEIYHRNIIFCAISWIFETSFFCQPVDVIKTIVCLSVWDSGGSGSGSVLTVTDDLMNEKCRLAETKLSLLCGK